MSETRYTAEVPAVLHICEECGCLASGSCELCAQARHTAQWLHRNCTPPARPEEYAGNPKMQFYARRVAQEYARLGSGPASRAQQAVAELRRVQGDAIVDAAVARWKGLEHMAKRIGGEVAIWAAVLAGAGILGLGMWEAGRLLLRVLLSWGA